MFKLILPFIFAAFTCQLTSASEPRTIEEYQSLDFQSPRILVIGSGHHYRDYPKNYFLVDRDQVNANPDLTLDFSQQGALPQKFIGYFDLVIWEFAFHRDLVKETTLTNIRSALKKGGVLLGNLPLTLITESMCVQGLEGQGTIVSPSLKPYGIDLLSTQWWKSQIRPHEGKCLPIGSIPKFPFLCLTWGHSGRDKVFQQFLILFETWLSKQGFADTFFPSHESLSEIWQSSQSPTGYFWTSSP